MDALELIGVFAAGLLQVVGVRSATEQPRYDVIDHVGSVEIRRYAARVAAEATVPGEEEKARNEGFRLVAGYIFGGNSGGAQIAMTAPVAQAAKAGAGQTIAMTAPVAQQGSDDGWRVQFFMPARYTLATLPQPKDARVRLVQLPPQTYAVSVFSGDRSPKAVAVRQARLAASLEGTAWKAVGPPQGWFYDPPWTPPFFRRNEAAVAVEAR